MSGTKKLWKEYKHFALILLFGLLYIWFYYLEKTVIQKYDMFSLFDLKIPFIKEFIIPYLFWYIYIIFGFIYLGIVSKKDYYKMFCFMFTGMVVCYAVYTLFPNGQNLRPVIKENDIFSRIIKYIYMMDTSTNVAPSIHVLNSIAVHVGLIGYEPFKTNSVLRLTSFILMFVISISTVFVKQHSILDGIWAIILSVVLYILIYILPDLIVESKKYGKRRKRSIIYYIHEKYN